MTDCYYNNYFYLNPFFLPLGSPDSDHVTITDILFFGGGYQFYIWWFLSGAQFWCTYMVTGASTTPVGQQRQWRRGLLPSEYVLQLVLTPNVSNPAGSSICDDHLICFQCMWREWFGVQKWHSWCHIRYVSDVLYAIRLSVVILTQIMRKLITGQRS